MENEPLSRELGPQEALFVELTSESRGGTQLISFVRLCDSVTVEQLCRGFIFLHGKHPMLRARIKMGAKPFWVCDVSFEKVPLSIKQLNEPLEYESEYLRQQNQFIDIESCAYGVTLHVNVNGEVKWVIIVSNHAALDGRSIMALFRDLDSFLEGEGSYISQEPKPLRKSAGEYLHLAGFKDVDLFSIQKSNSCRRWEVEQAAPIEDRKGNSILKLMPPEVAEVLSQTAKNWGVSLSSLFRALAVFAAQSMPTFPGETEIVVTIDIRGLCKPSISLDEVGSFSATANLCVTEEMLSKSLKSLAKGLDKQLRLILNKEAPFAISFDTHYEFSDVKNFAKMLIAEGTVFPSGICVSNAGNMQRLAGELRYFEIESGMVVQTHAAHPLMVITYTTSRNAIFVFGYCEPLTSHESAHLYVESYIKLVKSLLVDGRVQ
ncbi:hypothetical protein [Microbulbifer sp. JMSA003]|uniref:hypothetical protein n=1 Tax=unclassified Microbulbifer TaxID=2619833 RepID=UPI004038FEE0